MNVLSVKGKEKTLVKQIMLKKGITMDMLCESTGKAKSTLSKTINGNMTVDSLKIIADGLGVEISDLFPVKPGYVHWMERQNYVPNRNDAPSEKELELFRKFQDFIKQENDPSLLVNNEALQGGVTLSDAFNQ